MAGLLRFHAPTPGRAPSSSAPSELADGGIVREMPSARRSPVSARPYNSGFPRAPRGRLPRGISITSRSDTAVACRAADRPPTAAADRSPRFVRWQRTGCGSVASLIIRSHMSPKSPPLPDGFASPAKSMAFTSRSEIVPGAPPPGFSRWMPKPEPLQLACRDVKHRTFPRSRGACEAARSRRVPPTEVDQDLSSAKTPTAPGTHEPSAPADAATPRRIITG